MFNLVALFFLAPSFLALSIWTFKKLLFMLIDGEITALQSLWYFASYFLILYVFLSCGAYGGLLFILCALLLLFNLLIDPIRKISDDYSIDKQYLKNIYQYEEVVAKNPGDWGTLSEMAYCYYKLGKYEEAIAIQSDVVRLSKNDITETGKLKDYMKHYDKVMHPGVKCWYCGRMVPENAPICPNCRRSALTGEGIKSWLKGVGYKSLLIQLILAIVFAYLCAFIVKYFNISIFYVIDFIIVFSIFLYIGYILLYKKNK